MEPSGPQQDSALLQAAAERRVTVAIFGRPFEAHLARSRLAADGIESFVADEHLMALYQAPVAFGGVRLQVREWQWELARAVLE